MEGDLDGIPGAKGHQLALALELGHTNVFLVSASGELAQIT